MTSRIADRFAQCANENRPALAVFFMSGDPDYSTSEEILAALPKSGADIIELGMPFSDPMADGPVIQLAGQRALKAGQTLRKTLGMVADFRKTDNDTPIVLMGYYNPIYSMGVDRFLKEAVKAGVDGLILVDMPPEEDNELCLPALAAGIDFIRLITPTTDDRRMPAVLRNTSGFVYYVSMTGITGAALGNTAAVGTAVTRVKGHTRLPVVVGFGIKTPDDAATIGRNADGIAVGTAICKAIENTLVDGRATPRTAPAVSDLVRALAAGVRRART